MPPRHRAERGKTPRDPPAALVVSPVPGAQRSRRWRRRLGWFAAAAVTSAVALVALVVVGSRYNANLRFGEKREFGSTGTMIYERNCASCHGLQGQGRTGPAFAAGGPLSGLTFQQRVEKTGTGKPLNSMPRWRGKMSPEQIRMVAAYTQLLSGHEPEPSVAGVR